MKFKHKIDKGFREGALSVQSCGNGFIGNTEKILGKWRLLLIFQRVIKDRVAWQHKFSYTEIIAQKLNVLS